VTDGATYLRAGDIARLTGMSLRTVRRWISGGVISSVKLGGARLVAEADLDRPW
jgi:excisionase family DNA binding protein